ncbi:MAG TPA: matrixin family metalloprotease [Enhygromyxa sp.]|nr:matrixin family metalloprotease [Enhygromyxa sp.]
MIGLLTALPVLLGLLQCPALADPAVEPALACFVDQTPTCPEGRAHCVGIHLHVVVGLDGPVQTPAWTAEQLEHAHWLFEPADVGFQIVAVDSIGPELAHIATREQRDAIGRSRFSRGVVHVFLVARLDDVDVPGEQIRGVHWRQRSNTDKRWIILSKIGSKVVMGHELGHFFGLPHSRYSKSVMNKQPRDDPPWDQRVFVAEELAIVRSDRDSMFASGMLVEQARRAPPLLPSSLR